MLAAGLASALEIDVHPYGAAQHCRYRQHILRSLPWGGFNLSAIRFKVLHLIFIDDSNTVSKTLLLLKFSVCYQVRFTGPNHNSRIRDPKRPIVDRLNCTKILVSCSLWLRLPDRFEVTRQFPQHPKRLYKAHCIRKTVCTDAC